ncbi:MAG TPA: ATP-binding cassette domain-containing protein, partial [Terriglobales bacterium]|nr:ATP-binding cassette domain-containing protein [Terriglobales bacterium]
MEDVDAKVRESRIDTLLDSSGLNDAADRLVMKFSTGMYQKLGLARARLKNPKVLLLDEPARSLSPEATLEFQAHLQQIKAEGATILIATHNFDEANRVADRIAIIRNGKLAAVRAVDPGNRDGLRALYFDSIAGGMSAT